MSTSEATLAKPSKCGVPGEPCDCPIHDQVALWLGIDSTTGKTYDQLKREQSQADLGGPRQALSTEEASKYRHHLTETISIETKRLREDAAALQRDVIAKLAARELELLKKQREEEAERSRELYRTLTKKGGVVPGPQRAPVEVPTDQPEVTRLIANLKHKASDYRGKELEREIHALEQYVKSVPSVPEEQITPTPIPKGYGARWNDVCRDCHRTYDEHVEIITLGEHESDWACTSPPIRTERVKK